MASDKEASTEREPLLAQKKRLAFASTGQSTTGPDQKTGWASIWIACFVSFLCGASFALFLMSIWPFLTTLYPSVSTTFYSGVVACFSLGRGLASPLFGYWSNRIRTVKVPIIIGCFLNLAGNLLYIFAQLATGSMAGPLIVLFARLLMGIGSGIVPLTTAYAATSAIEKDKPKAISLSMAANVFGAGLGPGFQLAFTPLGNGYRVIGPIRFDMYTAPALCGLLAMVLAICLMFFAFKEEYQGINEDSDDIMPSGQQLPKFSIAAILVILFAWFVSSCVITTLEAIASPYMMVMYNWNDQQSVTYSSSVFLMCAMICAVLFAVYSYTKLHDYDTRYFVTSGLGVLVIFHLATYPWPFYTGRIETTIPAAHDALDNLLEQLNSSSILSIPVLRSNLTQLHTDNTITIPGCNNKYPWCLTTPQVPLAVLIVSYALFFSIGMAETAAPLGVLYAAVIGPRRMGTMQGIYAQVNAVARTVAPLVMLWLFGQYGPGVAWIAEAVLVLVSLVLVIVARKKLVPLKLPTPEARRALFKKSLMNKHSIAAQF